MKLAQGSGAALTIMRHALCFAVFACVLLIATEAHVSGSSTVYGRGKTFVVSQESVRKIFRHEAGHPNAEQAWHRNWREAHQPIVDAVAKSVEVALTAHVKKRPLPLIAYDEKLPEVWAWSEGDEEHSYASARKRGGPVRYVVRFRDRPKAPEPLQDMQLELALSTLPPQAELDLVIAAIEVRFTGR
ncbi:MAG: hypothetical protein IT381_01480 [Deltaproteobacteria bacterium]|nr:hypothetical protein [Deltaproteobacteria bacterium]